MTKVVWTPLHSAVSVLMDIHKTFVDGEHEYEFSDEFAESMIDLIEEARNVAEVRAVWEELEEQYPEDE